MGKNYINVRKEKYPKIQVLSSNVFGYIDLVKINDLEVYILFMCDKFGRPLGKIANTYFDYSDISNVSNNFWLIEYKKDLLKRILEDIELKKCSQTSSK